MQNSILNKTLIESFYIHCVPFRLFYSLKTRHAIRVRFHVFLRSHPEGGCQNSGMIVAPFASCLSSSNREPLFGCASPPSFLPACARAADAVVRDEDLGSRNPVHRRHGSSQHRRLRAARKYYQRSTFRRPRRVRGARASLEPGRGSDSRPGPTSTKRT